MIDFAKYLRDWRARHNLSQKEAGVILGVSLGTIQLWEKGQYWANRLDTETYLRRLQKFNHPKT